MRAVQILTFDPGGTTGWALMTLGLEFLKPEMDPRKIYNAIDWDAGQIEGPEDYQSYCATGLVLSHPGCAVVCEDFVLHKFSRDRELLSPVRITSKIEYGVYMLNRTVPGGRAHAWFLQDLTTALKAMPDGRLREYGFWLPGQEHARDAIRHGVTFLRRCRLSPALLREALRQVA